MLRCADGLFYTGMPSDLDARVNAHAGGRGGFTRHRLPVELVFYVAGISDAATARRVEHYIKSMTHARKVALVAGEAAAIRRVWRRAFPDTEQDLV